MAEFIYANKSPKKNSILILEYKDEPIDGIFEIRTSKSITQDFQKTPQDIQTPPYDYTAQLEMVDNDPVLGTAVDLTVDATTYNGFTFSGGSEQEINDCLKYFNDELDFALILQRRGDEQGIVGVVRRQAHLVADRQLRRVGKPSVDRRHDRGQVRKLEHVRFQLTVHFLRRLDVELSDREQIMVDAVMFATGRHPNTSGIGLEPAGVRIGRVYAPYNVSCLG